MKTCNMFIICAFAIAFLVIPVSAAEYTANGGPIGQIGTVTADQASAAAGVAPAAGYSNYFYFFNHGTAASTEDQSTNAYIQDVSSYGWGHATLLANAPSATLNATARVDLPVTSVASYTSVHPKIRYATIQSWSQFGTEGISRIEVYNGHTAVTTIPVDWHITGWADYTVDLGAYYDMVRGMNMRCTVYNSDTISPMYNTIGGFGAKSEW
jgi:hypothetical protein